MVAVVAAAAAAAAVLLFFDLHRTWPPPSASLAQMRHDAVVWQAALSPGWPSPYANDLTLPPAVARRIDARERAQLQGVETSRMVRSDLTPYGVAELMQAARRLNPQEPGEPVETLWQRRLMSLWFARRDWHGAIVCDAMVWSGARLSRYDATSGHFRPARSFDVEPLYELVFRRRGGRWRIDAATVLRYSRDTSPLYGPSTPHELMPPGWVP